MKSLITTLLLCTLWASSAVQLTIFDGGGRTYTTPITVKSSSVYTNYVLVGPNAYFTANSQPVHDIRIHLNRFSGQTQQCIFIGAITTQPQGTNYNIEIDSNYYTGLSGSQYYNQIASTSNVNIHGNYCVNSTGVGDGGFFYLQYSSFSIHNNFFDRLHGKALRLWPATSSLDTVYDNIFMNMDEYSPTELQEFYQVNDKWHVGYNNNTAGNLPVKEGNGTGLITLYFPDPSQINSTFSVTNNRVFNSSAGLLDNGSNTTKQPFTGQLTGPYAPSNVNWTDTSVNRYQPTMQGFGWSSDSAVTLPDGRPWQGSATVVAAPNKPPVSVTPAFVLDTLGKVQVTVDGSASYDPDGTIVSYQWQQLAGNPLAIVSPSASKTGVTGISVGVYTIQLTVTDNKGAQAQSVTTITGVMPTIPAPRKVVGQKWDPINGMLFNYSDGTTQ